ncbi:hypothetical protein ABIF65_006524 [Bradyrhizobium japonicum]
MLSREPSSFWPPSRLPKSPTARRLTRLPHPQALDRSNDGQDLTAKHHAGRKGKGTPVLTRRLERRIDNHLPVRNKIVERPQGILNFVLSGRANA